MLCTFVRCFYIRKNELGPVLQGWCHLVVWEPSANKGEVQKSEQPVCWKKRARHEKTWLKNWGKRTEVIEVKIKWNVKGVTLPFISNRNTCQNVGSENCIEGFIIFFCSIWSIPVAARDVKWSQKGTEEVNETLSFCQALNHYLWQNWM